MQQAENTLCNICLLKRIFTESQLATNRCNKENYEKIVSRAQMLFGCCFPVVDMLFGGGGETEEEEEINIKERNTIVALAVYVTYSVNEGIILLTNS